MKIKEVTVTYGVTVSYVKFRFVRLEYTLSANLHSEESVIDAMDKLRKDLRLKVAKDAKKEVVAWRKLGAQVEALDSTPETDFDFG